MSIEPTGPAECVHSFPDPYPQPLDHPGACRCGTTYEEAKQQMPAPAAIVTSRSVSLNITGPDVPNRYGEGHIAPSRVDFTYRTGEVRAWLEGRWRRTDGVLTDAPASQPYTGDMTGWPDWLADLARKHDPRGADLVTARETNQRLNYEKQRLESELATYRRAVAQWRTSESGTYIPLRTIAAIAKAAGRDIETPRWLLHYQRVEQAEVAIEAHRLALSEALDLGTGAPWDAIHERIAELRRPAAGVRHCDAREPEPRTGTSPCVMDPNHGGPFHKDKWGNQWPAEKVDTKTPEK